MIEQPKRQTGPRDAQWFYSICMCGKLVEVTAGIIPEHTFTTTTWVYEGPAVTETATCPRSLTRHGA